MLFVSAAFLVTNIMMRPQGATGVMLDAGHRPSVGSYSLGVAEGKAAWVVKGKGFTLDLTGRRLDGAGANGPRQDKYSGTGLLIDGARDVTIKNLEVKGYHRNIVLRNCENVRILNCRLDNSRAMRIEAAGKPVETVLGLRNISAWREYGAGVWMEKCTGCRIENCTASDAQNGIVIVDTSSSVISNNDCSYNGGWGIALWNSSHNAVNWNHADFCNRPGPDASPPAGEITSEAGWPNGWGANAAGIAVVNGCSKNQFVADSVTHCGAGILLTDKSDGGFNSTTQKFLIQGASNENVIAFTDASWSSRYAFESTFSKGNIYFRNIADSSACGFWLGFSDFCFLSENEVKNDTQDGIAIPQGAGNLLFRNIVEQAGAIGIHVWSNTGPVQIDKPALDNALILNRIADCSQAFGVERAIGTEFQANTIEGAATPPGFQQKGVNFAVNARAKSYASSQDGSVIAGIYAHRPANWQFYRDTAGPKGLGALRLGEYCPRRP